MSPPDAKVQTVGRSYAGVLGPLAMLGVIARGWLHTATVETVLQQATLALFAFAGIGWVIGQIAQSIVDDSVRGTIATELAAQEAAELTEAAESPMP